MTNKMMELPSNCLSDFITWVSFDGRDGRGWYDVLEDEREDYFMSLMALTVEPDEIDDTAIYETFFSR